MTTFQPSRSRVSYPGQPAGKPAKLQKDGTLPSFRTNYRPYGQRELPNGVTKGSPAARSSNRYGQGDAGPSLGELMGKFFP